MPRLRLPPRRLALRLAPSLGLLAAVACAPVTGGAPATPAGRFAAALEASDRFVGTAIAGMEGFEQRAERETRAIGFALEGTRQAGGMRATLASGTAPGAGAVEAADRVLAPSFDLLAAYARRLGLAAEGRRSATAAETGAFDEALVQAAAQGLAALPASAAVPPAQREAGLAGLRALAGLAAGEGGADRLRPQALAQEAQPHIAAIAAMLQAVIGIAPGQGTRGAMAARQDAVETVRDRFLQVVRRDRSLGPAARYALYQHMAALRDDDPARGTLAEVATLIGAMAAAHAALASGADPEPRLAAFEASVARLDALTGADQEE